MAVEKLIYIDLETTGLNFLAHSVVQIAGYVQIGDEVVQEFNINMQPHPLLKVDEGALQAINKTLEDLQANPYTQEEGFKEFMKILDKHVNRYDKLDKFFFVGYNNAKFDSNFLSRLFDINRNAYYGAYFWAEPYDAMVLAGIYLRGPRRMALPNFKLSTVAQELGAVIDETRLHDAMYDIELTKYVFEIVTYKIIEPLC